MDIYCKKRRFILINRICYWVLLILNIIIPLIGFLINSNTKYDNYDAYLWLIGYAGLEITLSLAICSCFLKVKAFYFGKLVVVVYSGWFCQRIFINNVRLYVKPKKIFAGVHPYYIRRTNTFLPIYDYTYNFVYKYPSSKLLKFSILITHCAYITYSIENINKKEIPKEKFE